MRITHQTLLTETLAVTLFLAFVLAIAMAAVGCASPSSAGVGAVYATEQADCLKYPTHNERTTCINQARAKWAADASDGGAE